MTDTLYLCLSILTMALCDLPCENASRLLPVRRKVTSPFVLSFLYYVPYAVLTAMTIPGIFFSTGSVLTACVGFAAALIAALFNRGLLIVGAFRLRRSACRGARHAVPYQIRK